jgi:GrpB-like predicted nucleotidyltransferase (UPF0157 family)
MRSKRGFGAPIKVVPYDGRWSHAFRWEAARLRDIFGSEPVLIHHIGSTSVPGLCAKPVIDILVESTGLELIDRVTPELELRGYVAKGEFGVPGRRYFSRPAADDELKVHVHAFLRGSPHVARHLGFRDRLRGDPKLVALLCALKRRLAAEHREDPDAYQAGKASFIGQVEAEATLTSPTP